jgi:hypothetical protein
VRTVEITTGSDSAPRVRPRRDDAVVPNAAGKIR